MKRPVTVEYIIRRGWPLAKVVKARRVPSGETAGMVEIELNEVRRFWFAPSKSITHSSFVPLPWRSETK